MKVLAALPLFVALTASTAAASDPLASLRFMVGTWNCTYQAPSAQVYYKATYAYDMGNNWLRESDAWKGGGSDLGMITYDPKSRAWMEVVMENERTVTLFRASGANPNRLVYRSVFPRAGMTDVFERTSPTRYTLHFTQSAGGRTMRSTDVCVKK